MAEVKEGKITKVIFHNKESGYTVAAFETADEQLKLVGTFIAPKENVYYKVSGRFGNHKKHGRQFEVIDYEEIIPTEADAIEDFLGSGAINGIGPVMAKKIVEKFGDSALEIMENTPERLLEVDGIGHKTLDKIIESYSDARGYAKVAVELKEMGIEQSQSAKIYAIYGARSAEIVRENPYQLIDDIQGISFKIADKIALRIGIAQDSEFRLAAGIVHVLLENIGTGSTYMPFDKLIEGASRLLDIDGELLEPVIDRMEFLNKISVDEIDGKRVIYLYTYYCAEQSVTWRLRGIKQAYIKPLSANMDNLIADAEYRCSVLLSDEQRRAVQTVLTENISVITGGPGTGKTTIVNILIKIFERMGMSVAIAAPTGRAANRISECSGTPAMTIHRLLEYAPVDDNQDMNFGRNEENPIESDVVIIDEASMIDLMLMDALLKAIKPGTRMIIVGDADQLLSVGAGNVLRDIIRSDFIKVVRLTEIFRQAKESLIVVNAHMINNGEYPESGNASDDFFIVEGREESEVLELLKGLFCERLENYYDFIDSYFDIQIISPSRREMLGTKNLNAVMQEAVNPSDFARAEIKYGNTIFREGDKVMQIKNNYMKRWRSGIDLSEGSGIFNGDTGIIESIDLFENKVNVVFDDKFAVYDFEEMDELELAYAITVHKSQGSEFPVVLIPIWRFYDRLMTRNLLYTAVTRAESLVVIVGDRYFIKQMVDNNVIDDRDTGLEYRLRNLGESPFGMI